MGLEGVSLLIIIGCFYSDKNKWDKMVFLDGLENMVCCYIFLVGLDIHIIVTNNIGIVFQDMIA